MKPKTITQWCEVFGIILIDNDGFCGLDVGYTLITLDTFIIGITVCTISVEDETKYRVLDYLIKIG